jgi:hypothetical protein
VTGKMKRKKARMKGVIQLDQKKGKEINKQLKQEPDKCGWTVR